MQTLLQLDVCLQSYEGFYNAKNSMKQRNLNTVFANISKTTSPTSDSFLLIMSHMNIARDVYLFFFRNNFKFEDYEENKSQINKEIHKQICWSIIHIWKLYPLLKTLSSCV